ncbi:MAG TPA: flagellar biosynthesis protein FlhB [Solirubrobacteraceae bacterium]|nr:flagellar biosynthesis protein FlhB [Solirubrobacteraceae bacterium]
MAENKTEKATPKKRHEARQKGQVARSQDVNGAVVLMASILALSAFGPGIMRRIQEATIGVLAFVKSPDVVDHEGVTELFMTVGMHVALASIPVIAVCALAGVAANIGQIGFKPASKALKPDFKKLNPLTGAKNLFGTNALVETVKNSLKIAAVGGIVALAVFPKLDELAALVGMPAEALLPHMAEMILRIAQWAAGAYLAIAAADIFYQRHRFEKSLKMDLEEVKQEHKQQELPSEVKGMQKRRAIELASARMMDAVPTADVVVTNPTHFSVALKYDSEKPAPVVVAKGADHLALRIRREAADHGVTVVPDPPLARALYASCDIGRMIPEELFQGVAQLLAYVYKVAGSRRAAA